MFVNVNDELDFVISVSRTPELLNEAVIRELENYLKNARGRKLIQQIGRR